MRENITAHETNERLRLRQRPASSDVLCSWRHIPLTHVSTIDNRVHHLALFFRLAMTRPVDSCLLWRVCVNGSGNGQEKRGTSGSKTSSFTSPVVFITV
ncbi:hypothetical protein PM082_003443 [Marasmius tenuissimus]|nr:hypothetical protein PM082_003443 [Marasmius tenuissimus]